MSIVYLLKSWKAYVSVFILSVVYVLTSALAAYGPLRNGLLEPILDDEGNFLYNLDRFPTWWVWSFVPVIVFSIVVYVLAFVHLSKALSCRKLEKRNSIAIGTAVGGTFLFFACAMFTAWVLDRITAAGLPVTSASIALLIGMVQFICIRFFTPLPN